jgi:hypothetical protein
MSDISHTAFFGDGEKVFDLTFEMIVELERKTGIGFGALYQRAMAGQFYFTDIMETIRLGMIGGGTTPAEAQALVDAYAKPTPIVGLFKLAFDILEMKWSGNIEPDAATKEEAPE